MDKKYWDGYYEKHCYCEVKIKVSDKFHEKYLKTDSVVISYPNGYNSKSTYYRKEDLGEVMEFIIDGIKKKNKRYFGDN